MKRLALALAVLAVLAVLGTARAQDTLQARQRQAQTERTELQAQIGALQKKVDASQASQADASAALRVSEQAISDLSRHLAQIEAQQATLAGTLARLDAAHAEQDAQLAREQQALAQQLRAQYASGLSPWAALLSGRDPQAIDRALAALSYVTRARVQRLDALHATQARLAQLREQIEDGQAEQAALKKRAQQQRDALQAQRDQRAAVLKRIGAQLRDAQARARDLKARDAQLGELVRQLDAQIAREQARREAAARERARREAGAARAAEAARRAQQARAAKPKPPKPSPAPDQAARAPEPPPPAAPDETAATPPRGVPAGGFKGLHKGLARPVAGADIQGRFGAERPEGGIWRGIVLRAPAGTPVHAVAAGRVVYAHWVSGFGNLLIIDHGAQYLSVYAYNQSLLKQVGDVVAAGDAVARVGATGGQVEPGLYFELRHQGAPINPLLWFAS